LQPLLADNRGTRKCSNRAFEGIETARHRAVFCAWSRG